MTEDYYQHTSSVHGVPVYKGHVHNTASNCQVHGVSPVFLMCCGYDQLDVLAVLLFVYNCLIYIFSGVGRKSFRGLP